MFRLSVSPAQVILKWLITEGWSVLPKSSNPRHIEENIKLDFNIDKKTRDILSSLSSWYICELTLENKGWHDTWYWAVVASVFVVFSSCVTTWGEGLTGATAQSFTHLLIPNQTVIFNCKKWNKNTVTVKTSLAARWYYSELILVSSW